MVKLTFCKMMYILVYVLKIGNKPTMESAEVYISRAQSQLKENFIIRLFELVGLASKPDYDLVAELYSKAANVYRMNKQYELAIDNYQLSADYYLKCDNSHEAINQYTKIIEILSSGQYQQKIVFYKKMLDLYISNGNFDRVNKVNYEIAQLYFDNFDYESAKSFYNEVIEMHDTRYYEKSLIAMTKIYLMEDNFAKMAKIYEILCDKQSKYYINVILCHLCNNDVVAATVITKRFCNMFHDGVKSYETDFVNNLINSYENHDLNSFMLTMANYKDYHFMHDMTVSLLVKIKHRLESESVEETFL
jgi:alpha-soluble NSF attachment protein